MAKAPKTTTAPTGQIAPFGLRMLPDLKQKIEQAARESGRSMNAEIVARLEQSFQERQPSIPTSDVVAVAQVDERIEQIERLLEKRALEDEVSRLEHRQWSLQSQLHSIRRDAQKYEHEISNIQRALAAAENADDATSIKSLSNELADSQKHVREAKLFAKEVESELAATTYDLVAARCRKSDFDH